MNCKNCQKYSPLVTPRELNEDVTIYGYCFQRAGFTNTGYPVYIPEGKCKNHEPLPGEKNVVEGQMRLEDFLEVMS